MNKLTAWMLLALALPLLAACGAGIGSGESGADGADAHEHGEDEHESGAADEDFERGPNGGRMLRDGDFAVELAIHEAGVPPEFRAWVTADGAPVDPASVDLAVVLTRLGGVDQIGFRPQDEYLRGDSEVYEPHSFAVEVTAGWQGREHRWDYESFEGRTRIAADMAAAMGIGISIAGPARLTETITVYGRIVPRPERIRELAARFDGAIVAVDVALGETVRAGQRLALIESDESLRSYAIESPIAGVVTERVANVGEQTRGRRLFTIVDSSSVWAELAIFPGDLPRVMVGQSVSVAPAAAGSAASVGAASGAAAVATSGAAAGPIAATGTIAQIDPLANPDQSITARVVVDNGDGRFPIGSYVTARIGVADFEVPLAVRRSALQRFRDFTVVFAQFGDDYEVRMLQLGRQDADHAEVRGGLEPGTRYVSENSYILKADVEKAGAAHDH